MYQLLSIGQSAAHLGKSERSVRRMVKNGEIPAYRIGGSIRLRQADVEQYIESRRIQRPVEPGGLKALVQAAVEKARLRRNRPRKELPDD